MDAQATSRRLIRTGLFEIDLSSGEMRKHGQKLALQGQPFRVLAMLLERPGELVTREELQSKLWAADTYVSFDEGLNTAIRKLRIVFGDSADNPRFIETMPRRGYRFVAPVSDVRENRLPGQADILVAGREAESQDKSPAENPEMVSNQLPRASGARSAGIRIRPWKSVFSAAVITVLISAGIAYVSLPRVHRSTESVAPKRVMLAVLPFQNLSNDPAQDYFSDGLTEETITDLGQLSPEKMGVIARTSAMAYKHTDKTISRIGDELGVDYIMEGSVRREGGKVRISAQLIRVSDQTHLWARNYDRELKDVIEVQNDLGKAIADQVQANLTPQRQMEFSRTRSVDPEAHDLYLKGRYYWNQRTPAGIKQSIGYFQQSVARDPNFAMAYDGLADAYNISNIVGLYSSMESLPRARAAAEKAITLDPTLAEAHAALGMEKSHYDFDFPGAKKEFLKALELNPNSSYAHLFYSNCYLLPMGLTEQAIAENQKAVALDPLSLPINNFLGVSYYYAGDYEKSYHQFQHVIAMDPSFPLAHSYLAMTLILMGRYEEAIKENEKGELLSGSSLEDATAEAAATLKAFKTGREKGFWRKYLELDLKAMKSKGYFFAAGVAWEYAMAGDKDKAFEWLAKSIDQREGGEITLLKVEPLYNSLHGDPRFSALLRRLGLPE